MNALAKLAPADEFLSYDIYVLKQKFMPVPPRRADPGGRAAGKRTRKKAAVDDASSVTSDLTAL